MYNFLELAMLFYPFLISKDFFFLIHTGKSDEVTTCSFLWSNNWADEMGGKTYPSYHNENGFL